MWSPVYRVKLAGWSYFSQFVVIGMGFLQIKILTAVLSQEQYGAWAQVNAAISLWVVVSSLNLGHGMIRLASSASIADQYHYRVATTVAQIGFASLLFLIGWPFANIVIGFIGTNLPNRLVYNLIFVVAAAILIANQWKNYLLVSQQTMKMVKLSSAVTVISALSVGLAAWLTGSVAGMMVGALLAQVLGILLLRAAAAHRLKTFRVRFGLLKECARLGVPLLLVSVAYWALTSSNRYFINGYMGAEAVALFNAASAVPAMIVMAYTAVSTIFFSKISRMYDKGEHDQLSIWMGVAVRSYALVSVTLSVGLIVGARQLTQLMANESYLFDELTLVYLLGSLGVLLLGLMQIYSRVFDLEKKPWRNALNWLWVMTTNALLCWLLIPQFGLVGAGAAAPIALGFGLFRAARFYSNSGAWRVNWNRLLFFSSSSLITAYLIARVWGAYLGIAEGCGVATVAAVLTCFSGIILGVIKYDDMRMILRGDR